MTPERMKELESNQDVISEEEWEDGWHFCPEWDGMLVNSNDKEGEGSCCICKHYPYPLKNIK